MANSIWGRKGEWRWNNARRVYPDNIPLPGSMIKGRRRPLGRTDITDLDPNVDYRKIMPLPYACACGNQMLLYTDFCSRCGRITPIGEWLISFGRC